MTMICPITCPTTCLSIRCKPSLILQALVANGNVWSKPPNPWLRGLANGVRDFAYGLYVHEDLAAKVLGPR